MILRRSFAYSRYAQLRLTACSDDTYLASYLQPHSLIIDFVFLSEHWVDRSALVDNSAELCLVKLKYSATIPQLRYLMLAVGFRRL